MAGQGYLVIPLNSLLILANWFPDAKIMELMGSGYASEASQSTSGRFGTIRTGTKHRVSLNFKVNAVVDAASWSEVFAYLKKTGVPDIKISSFSYAMIDEVAGHDLVIPRFATFNHHNGIFKNIVENGTVPNQSMIDYYNKLRSAAMEEIKTANDKQLEAALKTTKGGMLVLESIYPKTMIKDRHMIAALAQPPKLNYAEGIIGDWSLKELSYKRQGGPK